MEILDEGLVGVNEKGEILHAIRKPARLQKLRKILLLAGAGKKYFPIFPFTVH